MHYCDGIFTLYTQDYSDYYHFWIIFKSYSNMKNLSENLKGFIEPPCISL